MDLTIDLWNIILKKLNIIDLYNISLTGKCFYNLSTKFIEEKFKLYKDKYVKKCVISWKESVLRDKFTNDFFNEYLVNAKNFMENTYEDFSLKNYVKPIINEIEKLC